MKAPAAVQINLQYLPIITATVQQEQLESNQHNTDKRSSTAPEIKMKIVVLFYLVVVVDVVLH